MSVSTTRKSFPLVDATEPNLLEETATNAVLELADEIALCLFLRWCSAARNLL